MDRIRQLAARPAAHAGLAVFAVLYLHVAANSFAIGAVFGSSAALFTAVLWPFFGFAWATVPSLAVFAGVAFYVYWLKRASPGRRELERQVEHWRDAANGMQAFYEKEQGRMYGYAEEAQRKLREEMERREKAEARAAAAEARAAAAEAKAGKAGASAGAQAGASSEKQKAEHPKGGGDAKIREAKRAFARLYHPDNIQGSGLDKMIRQEFFKEFWRELERIEKSSAT